MQIAAPAASVWSLSQSRPRKLAELAAEQDRRRQRVSVWRGELPGDAQRARVRQVSVAVLLATLFAASLVGLLVIARA